MKSCEIKIPKCQERININLLTRSLLIFPLSIIASCLLTIHFLFSYSVNFLVHVLFHLTIRVSFFSSIQSKQSSSYSDRDTTEDDSESLEDMDFLSRQKKLQAEAKLALAMAKPMAKMQVEVEKQNRKKSPVADLVSVICIYSQEQAFPQNGEKPYLLIFCMTLIFFELRENFHPTKS